MVDISKCKLTKYPAPILSQVAKPIEEIDDNIRQLAQKMIDIMIENGGVGLAGPQAGVSLRIFIVSPDASREKARAYINPELDLSGPVEMNDEGCLSFPGVFIKVRRYKKCTIKALDLDGNEFTETGEGLLSRAFQHEYDHLEGTLLCDRMSRIQQIANRKKLKDLRIQYEEGNPLL